MTLKEHAKNELELIGYNDSDNLVYNKIMELINIFCNQGHSGSSAPYISKLFYELANYKTLSPLTDNDDEWNYISDNCYQNNRNSAVFKENKDSKPYYIDAYVLQTDNGLTYNGTLELKNGKRISKCYIKDYTKMPTITMYVDEIEVSKDSWYMTLKNEKQLKELSEYYDLYIK